jgi:hypothetical protein
MEPRLSTVPEPVAASVPSGEAPLVEALLALYDEEGRLYRGVLTLARQQLDAVQRRAALPEVRGLLAQKRAQLEQIDRLEAQARLTKEAWRRGRSRWSPEAKARVHRSLCDITGLVEEILSYEERCDAALLSQAEGEGWKRR